MGLLEATTDTYSPDRLVPMRRFVAARACDIVSRCPHAATEPMLASVMFGLLAIVWLVPSNAHACPQHTVGGSALTTIGTERPFEGRVRGAAELQYRTEEAGSGASFVGVTETRLDLWLAYAPNDRVTFTVQLPVLHREVEYANLARFGAFGVGDLEAGARVLLLRDREYAPEHALSVLVAGSFPTAMRVREEGVLAAPERQLGTGAAGLVAELLYVASFEPVSILATVRGQIGFELDGVEPGPELSFGATGQLDVVTELALRLGASARWAGPVHDGGVREPDTGGLVVYVTPSVLVMPVTGLVLSAGVQIPIADALAGEHSEGPAWRLGASHDF